MHKLSRDATQPATSTAVKWERHRPAMHTVRVMWCVLLNLRPRRTARATEHYCHDAPANCHRDSLLRLRKFVPLYLHGYTSAAPLRAALLRAETLDHWRAAAYDERLYDADEPYPSTAVRFPRLKGGGVAVRQSMGLPNGWLGAEGEGGLGAEAEVLLADDVCEG